VIAGLARRQMYRQLSGELVRQMVGQKLRARVYTAVTAILRRGSGDRRRTSARDSRRYCRTGIK